MNEYLIGDPLVSIIIPCYNQDEYLPDAIESALGQDYPNTEVIVVDDGSSDNTWKVARRYDKQITLVRQKNKGLPSARNFGISHASGEYILCLDADDRILPAFISSTATVLNENECVGIVATGWRFFGNANYTVIPKTPSFVEHLAVNTISCSCLFRKSGWQGISGFDESMTTGFEDWDFWIRMRKSGYELEALPDVLFEYRRKGPSMGTSAFKRSREILRFLHEKHNDLYVAHFKEIHLILFETFYKKRELFKIEQTNSQILNIQTRLKYLAKSLLPASIIHWFKKLLVT